MKNLAVALIALGLVGCTNPYNYREDQEVLASYTTAKTPEETQECILAAWQKNPLMYQIIPQKTGKYYSVFSGADNADVFADGEVTRINFYSLRGALDVTNGIEKRKAAIKTCL
ncbi:hypothetical protein [Pantoea agglomerans]|jgi:hypothetical protein|uniref:hypothetical protein n=1 Tax=Enterobacter agglomerans TaxID=549 RepID=UPI00289F1A72|nr:hypothetical protein [Pantoea agglomerans]WNK36865.1 hypothetical protein RM158_08620 [Pantoea agglomerans]